MVPHIPVPSSDGFFFQITGCGIYNFYYMYDPLHTFESCVHLYTGSTVRTFYDKSMVTFCFFACAWPELDDEET